MGVGFVEKQEVPVRSTDLKIPCGLLGTGFCRCWRQLVGVTQMSDLHLPSCERPARGGQGSSNGGPWQAASSLGGRLDTFGHECRASEVYRSVSGRG